MVIVGRRVRTGSKKGNFGETSLDGVTFAGLWAWPGAIHEGRGEAVLIIDEQTNPAQREAIRALFYGEETEPGATIFNVFRNVIDTYHEPIIAPIEFEADVEARTGHYRVPESSTGIRSRSRTR